MEGLSWCIVERKGRKIREGFKIFKKLKKILEEMLLQFQVPAAVMRNGEGKRTAASFPAPMFTV